MHFTVSKFNQPTAGEERHCSEKRTRARISFRKFIIASLKHDGGVKWVRRTDASVNGQRKKKPHIIRNGINDTEAQSRNDLISNFQF